MDIYVPDRQELNSIKKPAKVKGNRWGFCGIAAMSAAIGIAPLKICDSIPDWPGYTPSRMLIETLAKFGYDCRRILIPKLEQQMWPLYQAGHPSKIAIGRIYWSEGKYADSHWICFNWSMESLDDPYPGLYDNTFYDGWWDTRHLKFYIENRTAKLKSLYFVIKGEK
ncbi:MAG: hypothetical protein AB1553_01860 [Nitrospirota bacterium]